MSIYVDGCCNKTIGACSTCVNHEGVDLIKEYQEFLDLYDFLCWFEKGEYNGKSYYKVSFNDVQSQQNNGAELLAMIIGIEIAMYFGYDVIKSDSQLMVDHWSKKISSTIKDERKAKLQRFLVKRRLAFEAKGGRIEKIPGDANIADLGFHKRKY